VASAVSAAAVPGALGAPVVAGPAGRPGVIAAVVVLPAALVLATVVLPAVVVTVALGGLAGAVRPAVVAEHGRSRQEHPCRHEPRHDQAAQDCPRTRPPHHTPPGRIAWFCRPISYFR
jgi:hypothetical protein